jgi:hypothetical protein
MKTEQDNVGHERTNERTAGQEERTSERREQGPTVPQRLVMPVRLLLSARTISPGRGRGVVALLVPYLSLASELSVRTGQTSRGFTAGPCPILLSPLSPTIQPFLACARAAPSTTRTAVVVILAVLVVIETEHVRRMLGKQLPTPLASLLARVPSLHEARRTTAAASPGDLPVGQMIGRRSRAHDRWYSD